MGARSDGTRKVTRGGRPRWVIDFRYFDKDGREQRYRRDAHVQTAAGARAEAARLMEQALARGTLDPRPIAPLFSEFVETKFRPLYMPTHCRPATVERYEALFIQGVLDFFGNKRLDAIRAQEVRAYAAEIALRRIHARNHLSIVRTVLRAAVEFGALEAMPELPPLPRQGRKLPDAPSDEDVGKLLANARGWLHTAIALSVYAGLRMGEARALEVCDVDFKRGQLMVRHALSADEVMPPKSGHERVVPLAPELRAVLETAVRLKMPHARVVVNERGVTPKRQRVLTALKRLEQQLGVREWSFHSLRHYFCSALIRRGASVEAVRLLAGHSKLDVTQRYVHATGDDLRAAIARLPGN
jgi:integrase